MLSCLASAFESGTDLRSLTIGDSVECRCRKSLGIEDAPDKWHDATQRLVQQQSAQLQDRNVSWPRQTGAKKQKHHQQRSQPTSAQATAQTFL